MGETAQGNAGGWTLRRQKGSPFWFVRFRHEGRRHEKSTRETDRAAARGEAARIYAETVSGRVVSVATTTALKTLLAEWCLDYEAGHAEGTAENVVGYSRAFLRFFGELARITPASCSDYVRARIRKVTRTTLRKELSALRQFVAWAHEKGALRELVEVPSIPKVGHTGHRAKHARKRMATILTPAEVERILAAMPERTARGHWCRPFWRILWETGLRSSTVVALETPRDYQKGARELFLPREGDKAHDERVVPLTPAARKALDLVLPEKGGPLFERVDFRYQLREAVTAAKIGRPVSEYDFRHSRLTQLANTPGVPLTGVQFLAGHKHISTTAKYVRAQREAADAALRIVAGGKIGGRGAR